MSFFLYLASVPAMTGQAKKVDPALLDELVGGYQVEVQGQKGIYVFIAEEGQLKGSPAGESPYALEPVEGDDLIFVGHSPDGIEYRYKFLRNEEGRIAKCILSIPSMGLVLDMIKLEK